MTDNLQDLKTRLLRVFASMTVQGDTLGKGDIMAVDPQEAVAAAEVACAIAGLAQTTAEDMKNMKNRLQRVFNALAGHVSALSEDHDANPVNAVAAVQVARAMLRTGQASCEDLDDMKKRLYRMFDCVSAHAYVINMERTVLTPQSASAAAAIGAVISDVELTLDRRALFAGAPEGAPAAKAAPKAAALN